MDQPAIALDILGSAKMKKAPIANSLTDAFLPTIVVCTLFHIVVGPFAYPVAWSHIIVIFLVIQDLLTLTHTIKWAVVARRISMALNVGSNTSKLKAKHVIIIPNYMEPLELIRQTLTQLATHPMCKLYHIVLAMEESEPQVDRLLKAELANQFPFEVSVTIHPRGIPGEARGKASNTSWAVQQIAKKYPYTDNVYITIQDADSQIPFLYFNYIQQHLDETTPRDTVFIPPPFFGLNHNLVPAPVRIQDACQSLLQCQNLANPSPLCIFATSNYTLPLSLAIKVGFWDTGYRGVGEDMHMTLKCLYMGAVTQPIYVPIPGYNLLASSYSESLTQFYQQNMLARYTQAKRHYNADSDVSFSMYRIFHPVSSQPVYKRILYFLQVCELYILTATIGWISAFACLILSYSPQVDDLTVQRNMYLIQRRLLPFFALLQIVNLLIYEVHHRQVSQRLNLVPRKLVQVLDYVWLAFIGLLFVTIPATHAALVNGWSGYKEQEYVVAEKQFAKQE
jgi:hypothetical protein